MTDYDSWKTDNGEWKAESLEHSHDTAFDLYTESKLAKWRRKNKMNENELRALLKNLKAQAEEQTPYFDDRLLSRISQIEQILEKNNP